MEYTFPFYSTIDLKNFLEDVKKCENEVFFESTEGDKLALHSALSQFILYSVCTQPDLLTGAIIRCSCKHDRDILSTYFCRQES